MATHDNGEVGPDHFRELMSRFPTGVAVITTIDQRGQPQGMTCSSLASVCVSPSILLVSLRTASATCAAIETFRGFAVNLMHVGGRRAAEVFSTPRPDRFGAVAWRRSEAGLPWLSEDAVAMADCVVVETKALGDHTVVFGEVRRMVLADGRPLLYGMRAFLELPVAVGERTG